MIAQLSWSTANGLILMFGKKRIMKEQNLTSIYVNAEWYKDDPFILASQVQQVFYIDDLKHGPNWKIVQQFGHRHL